MWMHAGLHLPVARGHVHLDSISCLTNLRRLELPGDGSADEFDGVDVELDAATNAAIAQHTQLTRLSLFEVDVSRFGCGFLSGLQQLQELSATLSPAELPVIAGLTQLTWLECDWWQPDELQLQQMMPAGSAGAVTSCPAVRALVTKADAPPFEAFPGLEQLVQGSGWQPAAFTSLAQHCKGLQKLHISSHVDVSMSNLYGDAAAECAAAVPSLSALQQLTWLSFVPNDRAEVAALAALAALQQLRGLMVQIPARWSQLQLSDLAALSALQGLKKLTIELPSIKAGSNSLSCKEVQQVLASVRHVRSVRLYLDAGRVPAAEEVVREARQANAAAGVGGPANLLVAALDPGGDYRE
uniref:Uncharacterized protein n=2 Tax=Tetradesmus obliquus TaxID=3088 RepID=A0A383WAE0_TETOB|eukprot:jgi/Sobl393_1/19510/SZX74170.1